MPRTSKRLTSMFQELSRVYFPRWRGAPMWTIRQGSRARWRNAQGEVCTSSEQGFCDDLTKTIWVNTRPDTLELVIIHEICHAVTSGGHDSQFCKRMRAAAKQATQLGNIVLAEKLEREAAMIEEQPRFTSGMAYQQTEDWIHDNPSGNFENIVNGLAYLYGMTPDEVLKQFPRLRDIYDRTHRQERAHWRQMLIKVKAAGNPDLLETIRARALKWGVTD